MWCRPGSSSLLALRALAAQRARHVVAARDLGDDRAQPAARGDQAERRRDRRLADPALAGDDDEARPSSPLTPRRPSSRRAATRKRRRRRPRTPTACPSAGRSTMSLGSARAVGQQHEAVVARRGRRARRRSRPGARRRARRARPPAPRRRAAASPSPSSTTNSSSSALWQCGGVAERAGRDRDVAEPAARRAGAAEVAPRRRDVAAADGRAARRRRARRSSAAAAARARAPRAARRRLGLERVRRVERDPVRAGPHDAGARQPGQAAVSEPLAERQHVEPAVAGRRACAARPPARWTMQSPAPTRTAAPSCQLSPSPARTKKISSSSPCDVHGHRALAGGQRVAAERRCAARRPRAPRRRRSPRRSPRSSATRLDVVPVHRHPAAMLVPAVARREGIARARANRARYGPTPTTRSTRT